MGEVAKIKARKKESEEVLLNISAKNIRRLYQKYGPVEISHREKIMQLTDLCNKKERVIQASIDSYRWGWLGLAPAFVIIIFSYIFESEINVLYSLFHISLRNIKAINLALLYLVLIRLVHVSYFWYFINIATDYFDERLDKAQCQIEKFTDTGEIELVAVNKVATFLKISPTRTGKLLKQKGFDLTRNNRGSFVKISKGWDDVPFVNDLEMDVSADEGLVLDDKKYEEMATFNKYLYPIFSKTGENGYDISKTFDSKVESGIPLFDALVKKPSHGLSIILGLKNGEEKKEDKEIVYLDLLARHTLVGGLTRSGKTNFLNQLLISLVHFHHPEYLKIILIDAKAGVLKNFAPITSYVSGDHDEMLNKVWELCKIIDMRKKWANELKNRNSAQEANEYAYKKGTKKDIWQYIVCVIDEFHELIEEERERKKNTSVDAEKCDEEYRKSLKQGVRPSLSAMFNRIAGQGSGLGVSLVFSTQAPYAKYCEGSVKNNFSERICFKVSGSEQAHIILGKKKKECPCPTELPNRLGYFLYKDAGERKKLQTILISNEAIKVGVRRLKKGGFNFSI